MDLADAIEIVLELARQIIELSRMLPTCRTSMPDRSARSAWSKISSSTSLATIENSVPVFDAPRPR